tara:strand:+ start:335 stop:745 length:411 start_codon:yes stop_codon:yes gene_type:complete
MSNKERDLLDSFTKKMVKDLPIEKPSNSFSKNVMNVISNLEAVKSTYVYEPLISMRTWFLIISSLIVSMVLLLKTKPIKMPNFISEIDTSGISSLFSFDVSLSFTASNITLYGFFFLAIMAFIQFNYIRNYYNNYS